MQVSKSSSNVRRPFASLDIHYNYSLNTEVQKHIEPKKKKFQTKVVKVFRDSLQYFFQ